MQFSFTTLATSALLLTTATAHFTLDTPRTAGFDDAREATGPCGGFDVDLNSATDFRVGGDKIQVTNGHPIADFLFRITPNSGVNGNFTVLRQPVRQTGAGRFCLPMITVPERFIGSRAVLQVISNGADGTLYQCAALNFVSGMGDTNCNNGTGVTGSYVNNQVLSPLAAGGNSSTVAPTTTTNSSAPAATHSHSAAAGKVGAGFAGAALMALGAGFAGLL